MFDRVIHADWVNTVPPIAFACFAIAFGLVLFRSLTLPKKEIERISHLPLQDDSPQDASDSSATSAPAEKR